ncbi:MAG: LysM peptidoglycan-binding domain-containing protein [Verrucomicrobiota bacterium]
MTKFLLSLATIAATTAWQSADGNDVAIRNLESRVGQIESRLSTVEKAVEVKPHQYSDATYDATVSPLSAPQGQRTYVIQNGDTLGSIASQHGVSRSELLESNRLSDGQPIYIGETLLIPGGGNFEAAGPPAPKKTESAPPVPQPTEPEKQTAAPTPPKESAPAGQPRYHMVVRGDTLHSLARKYGTSVSSLRQINQLRGDHLSLGQRLIVSSTSAPTAPPDQQQADATDSGDSGYSYDNPLLRSDETYGYYTIRKGDNLYALARDFFTTMGELQRLNKLGSSTLIHPGKEIIVPTSKYNAYHSQGDVAQR